MRPVGKANGGAVAGSTSTRMAWPLPLPEPSRSAAERRFSLSGISRNWRWQLVQEWPTAVKASPISFGGAAVAAFNQARRPVSSLSADFSPSRRICWNWAGSPLDFGPPEQLVIVLFQQQRLVSGVQGGLLGQRLPPGCRECLEMVEGLLDLDHRLGHCRNFGRFGKIRPDRVQGFVIDPAGRLSRLIQPAVVLASAGCLEHCQGVGRGEQPRGHARNRTGGRAAVLAVMAVDVDRPRQIADRFGQLVTPLFRHAVVAMRQVNIAQAVLFGQLNRRAWPHRR